MKIYLLLVCTWLAFNANAQEQATLLHNWNKPGIPAANPYNNKYNEVWGFEQNEVEYAVIGSTLGLHVFDVSNPPTSMEKEHFLPGTSQGTFLIHRDFKTFQGHLYAVSDEGNSSTLQIFDLSQLPDTITQVYASNEFVVTSHNLFIDTVQSRLYLLGAGNKTKALDITNPAQPTLLATYPKSGFNLPYTHDAYVMDNIGFMNCGSDGFWMVDFTNAATPVVLGTMTTYAGAGYNHSGWRADNDPNVYFLCDETHGSPVKTVDITNPLEMELSASINAQSTPNQIPHNAVSRGNYLYVSYYYDGLQVFDMTNPDAPVRAYYYDSSTIPNNNSYQGAWGVFPLKKSGKVLLSDMQNGLFVFAAVDISTNASEPLSKDFVVAPNPAHLGNISIQLAEIIETDHASWEMVDMLGKRQATGKIAKGSNMFEVALGGISNGLYVLHLADGAKKGTKKIIIDKKWD